MYLFPTGTSSKPVDRQNFSKPAKPANGQRQKSQERASEKVKDNGGDRHA
ncbi:hypothetical protein ACSS6W_000830 [Trichoderma asperelloides]